jgi:hypothetical protein
MYLLVLSMVTSCSDSSSGSNSAEDLASVNAGIDSTVLEGETITLDATVYPDGGTVIWTQLSGDYIDGFPTTDELTVEVVAQSVSLDSELVFSAEYTSLDGQIVYDEVTVQVTNIDYDPISVISLEDDDSEPFNSYETITVSGTGSYDQDGEVSGYLWSQIDTNESLTFVSDTSSSELQFKAPFVATITTFTLQLTVTDNEGFQGINTIDIQIAAATGPIAANAGEDQAVDEYTTVTLNASDSGSSVSEVSCVWEQTYGSNVTIDDTESCITTFIAADVDTEEDMIFTVTVIDTAANTDSDDAIITVTPINLGLLHDTGITTCFNDSEEIDCDDSDFPEQDADTGRDAISDLLDKTGDGPRSYDFTKFDANGDELDNDSLIFSCVRDNFTGLIWEVKQSASIPEFENLRGAENYYSMDDSQDPLVSCPSDSSCGQDVLISSVNDAGFCGGANWRLPTYLELLNLMDYNDVDNGYLLPSDFFTETPDVAVLGHKFYWVSDGSAEGGTTDFNWVLDLATGDDSAILTSSLAYVILVRTAG